MQAHKVEVVLSENGTLVLEGLPFRAGEAVEVIILERPQPQRAFNASSEFPLQGTVLFYDDPFEPAVPPEEWDVLK
ncbi:MAG: hypothetical protein NW224_28110 [Leptolyngbyaceae cyanobacterium bins.302]|nr:hypothetical protein [Leptolyngbyaceae cyanobacterium bins.302]